MLSPCAYALTLTKAFPVSCFELAYEYSLDIKLRVDLFIQFNYFLLFEVSV